MKSTLRSSRRSFLQHLGVAGVTAPCFIRHLISAPPSGALLHASFGAGGMAGTDLTSIASLPNVKLVAVADVDLPRAEGLKKKYPDLKVYQDWRELLDKEKDLHSVNVSTPDHMHAPIGMACLQLGKHVYGQKPLTHDIYESRRLTEVARENKLVTQMGIQVHSNAEYRLAVRVIQDGVIGKVKEVHTWSNKTWGDASARPDRVDPVPANFNWDLWLGVTAERPFIGGGYYHPGNWRRRLDFGTGTFGDMGCHIYDPVFKALGVTAPVSVRSEGSVPTAHNWGLGAVVHYVFPGTQYTDGKTVKVVWYDGDKRPPADILSQVGDAKKIPGQGSIFIGTKGIMVLPHVSRPQLFPIEQFKDYQFPDIKGANHWGQFVSACRGEGQTSAHFGYSGPLTETILLGGVASRFPMTTLEWDAATLKFPNHPDANQYVRRTYRKGWEVKGL